MTSKRDLNAVSISPDLTASYGSAALISSMVEPWMVFVAVTSC